MFPVSQSVCSVIRSLRPQERLHFHTKCLLLDCIDSPHRVTLMLLAVIWQNRGQQQLAHGPVLAHQLEHPPDIFFLLFDINSQRSYDSSSTRVVDPAGRGTCFTEAIMPSANMSESAVTITYITKQPVVLWNRPWPSRQELIGRSLNSANVCTSSKSTVLLHGKAVKDN